MAERTQHLGVRHDEIGCLDLNRDRYSIATTPVHKIVEDSAQRRNQVLINFMGDQFYGIRFGIAGGKRLQSCTAENASAGGGIKDTKPRSAGCDSRGHKISHRNRREIKTMGFTVLVGLAFDVPGADAVGIDSGSFSLPGSRYCGATCLGGRPNRLHNDTGG